MAITPLGNLPPRTGDRKEQGGLGQDGQVGTVLPLHTCHTPSVSFLPPTTTYPHPCPTPTPLHTPHLSSQQQILHCHVPSIIISFIFSGGLMMGLTAGGATGAGAPAAHFPSFPHALSHPQPPSPA